MSVMGDQGISAGSQASASDFFAATSGVMDHTQQVNLLFALERGLPDLKQTLATVSAAKSET